MKGHVSPAGFNIVVRIFEPSTDTEVMKAANSTDANGYFWICGIPVGTYDVGIKTDNSLSILAANQTFIANQVTEIDFGGLLRGDLDMDDDVDGDDYYIFAGGFGHKGTCWGYSGNWTAPPTVCVSTPQGINWVSCVIGLGMGTGFAIIFMIPLAFYEKRRNQHASR